MSLIYLKSLEQIQFPLNKGCRIFDYTSDLRPLQIVMIGKENHFSLTSLMFVAGGEDRLGLGTDERHQAHLAATGQGGGGGRVQGFLQDLL